MERRFWALLSSLALLSALQLAHAASQLPAAAAPADEPLTYTLAPPVLHNYTLNSSRDTFEVCRNITGIHNDLPLEELLPVFHLPASTLKHKHISLPHFMRLMQKVGPEAQVIISPMLLGAADLVGTPTSGLPNLIHFTVRDKNQLTPHQAVSIASWAAHNPGHTLLIFDDADISLFMTTHFPELLPTFQGLGSQVERADLWRYLVLCIYGGVYADSDVVSGRPISQWTQDAGLLVGVENVFKTLEEAKQRTYTRQVQMVQWVIAARRGHPVVCRMGSYIQAHRAKEAAGEFSDPDRDHAILERTGPGIWSSSVHDYVSEQGYDIRDLVAGAQVGDVRVLPQPMFGCPSSQYQEGGLPYVFHMFKGSWRAEPLYTRGRVLEWFRRVFMAVAGFTGQEIKAAKQAYEAAADRLVDPSAFGVRGSHQLGSSRVWLRGVTPGRPGSPGQQVHQMASLLLLVSVVLVLILTGLLTVRSWPWCGWPLCKLGSSSSSSSCSGLTLPGMAGSCSPSFSLWLRRCCRRGQLLFAGCRGGLSSGSSSSGSSSLPDLMLPFVAVGPDRGGAGGPHGIAGAYASSQNLADIGRLKRNWGSSMALQHLTAH